MHNNIDLTIQKICGIACRTGGSDDGRIDNGRLSTIKAHVSFFGSIPNLKVFSFDMCPQSGALAVESSTPEDFGMEEKEVEKQLEENRLLELNFTDPFQKRQQKTLTSCNSLQFSETTRSQCHPHLQFNLRESQDNGNGNEQPLSNDDISDSQRHETLKFQIVLKLPDIGVIAEGVANLRIPKGGIGSLPIDLNVPIIQTGKQNSVNIEKNDSLQSSQICFDNSAYICVHLNESVSAKVHSISNELRFYSVMDEKLNRKLKQRTYDCEEDVHDALYGTEFVAFGEKDRGKRRFWSFECNGTVDIGHSIKSFFDGIRRYRARSTDPGEELKLFTNSTMTSTILTRESLKI